jgi:diacylglycerol kinase (ATP)
MQERLEKIVSKPPPRIGPARLLPALRHAMQGLASVWRTEGAFRQEVVIAAVLVPAACFIPVTRVERAALVASILFVIVVELLNSSLEAAIDRISDEWHPLSKHAKDAGSAAVLVSIVIAIATWGIIAGGWLLD